MGAKEMVKEVTNQGNKYGVDKEAILLLRYSKALKNRKYAMAEKMYKSVRLIRSQSKNIGYDGLIALNPPISFICKLGKLWEHK